MEWAASGGSEFPVTGEMQVEMEPTFGGMSIIFLNSHL